MSIEAVPDYSNFLQDLKIKLKNSEESKKSLEEEVQEYLNLLGKVNEWSTDKSNNGKGYDTHVDIGEKCFIQAHVPYDNLVKSLYVHIGMGYHVEVLLENVPELVQSRRRLLEQKISFLDEEIVNIRADYEQVMSNLSLLVVNNEIFIIGEFFFFFRPYKCGQHSKKL